MLRLLLQYGRNQHENERDQMKTVFDEIPVVENERIVLRKMEDADALQEMIRSRVHRYLPAGHCDTGGGADG